MGDFAEAGPGAGVAPGTAAACWRERMGIEPTQPDDVRSQSF